MILLVGPVTASNLIHRIDTVQYDHSWWSTPNDSLRVRSEQK